MPNVSKDEIPLFPVAGWSVGPVVKYDAVTIKFDFLTNLLQRPDEANEGRHYVLLRAQALELAQQIQKAIHFLENAEPQDDQGPKH